MVDFKRRIQGLFKGSAVDHALISSYESLRYFSGFKGLGGAYLLLSADGKSRLYVTELEAPDAQDAKYDELVVVEKTKNFQDEVLRSVGQEVARGVLGLEDESVTLSLYEHIKKYSDKWAGISQTIEQLRSIKDEDELRRIKGAISVAEESFKEVLKEVKPGVTENHVAAELEKAMKERGAEGVAFPTIVASGERAANPHATSSNKKIRDGEVVVIDFGAQYEGYDSDLTRTVFMGEVGQTMKRAFEAVRETQATCFASLKLGQPLSEVAKLAITNLAKYGLDKYYIHSLGHGIGLDVHEYPYLSVTSKDRLSPGHVFTIEPGVYIPGVGGIRIEDDFLAEEKEVRRLSSLPVVP